MNVFFPLYAQYYPSPKRYGRAGQTAGLPAYIRSETGLP